MNSATSVSFTGNISVPKKRHAAEIEHMMSRLSSKSHNKSTQIKQSADPPKRRQCSEIAKLTSELDKKINSVNFTKEVHLKPSDPGYGKPQEGTETAARGKRAHEHISSEIVEMVEIIWEHGQMTGQDIIFIDPIFPYF